MTGRAGYSCARAGAGRNAAPRMANVRGAEPHRFLDLSRLCAGWRENAIARPGTAVWAKTPVSLTVSVPAAISMRVARVRVPRPLRPTGAVNTQHPTERSRSGPIRAPESNTRTRTMFAVIRTGGKQYRVAAEDVIKVDKVKGDPGEIVQFGEVLVVGGDNVTLGAPDRCRRLRRRRGAGAGPRRQGHRLQEAPPQEFAPEARPPAGIHAAAGDRDPDRRRHADQDGEAQARAQAEAGGGRTDAAGETAKKRGAQGQGREKAGQRSCQKSSRQEADKPKSGAKARRSDDFVTKLD